MHHYHPLSKEEEAVIVNKATEPPGSGNYLDHFKEAGIFACKRCDAPLFLSEDKFASGCGWPSFEDALPQAVLSVPDLDGERTEIVCARCQAHLGHLFLGEGFTAKNRRHCVNSLSLTFVPATLLSGEERALFAAGCFWGVEEKFSHIPGVTQTAVGYTGGCSVDPTYSQVCSGKTKHAESVELIFDPRLVSYQQLVEAFFKMHDATQYMRQGPDIGEQYRSSIFYLTRQQKEIAEGVKRQLQEKGLQIETIITPATLFYPAEEEHQHYVAKQKKTPP